jgi:hypothetical protein
MWQCLKCHEESEHSFDVCWACGTSRDGVEDPLFRPVAESESPTDLMGAATTRGLWAGAAVAVLLAFLHPFVMAFLNYLVHPVPMTFGALTSVLFFGFLWAMFAAVGGGIAGAIAARTPIKRSALMAGLLSGVLFHLAFLASVTNAFGHWPPPILLGSLIFAALSGTLAGSAGFFAGRKCRPASCSGNRQQESPPTIEN